RADGPRTRSHPPADGTVILFQGDSITDAGRDRAATDPNAARALGSGYPLLVASAALASHPDRGLRFYNRAGSGNEGPALSAPWTIGGLRNSTGGGRQPSASPTARERRSCHSSRCSTNWRGRSPRSTGPPMASTPRPPDMPSSQSGGVTPRSFETDRRRRARP